jgi:hypothetical protein
MADLYVRSQVNASARSDDQGRKPVTWSSNSVGKAMKSFLLLE